MKSVQQSLDPKLFVQFKTLVKFYEQKQYKKGLKQAEKILEAKPDHPETLSLKGLFLYFTDKKEEGESLCKLAVSKNMKSEMAWHIYGIIHRTNKNWSEAIKCYKLSLKYDPENLNVLKDLALMQMHVREFQSHCDNRLLLLQNNPKVHANWVAFAVANHLIKDYKQAREVLASLWKILQDQEVKGFEKNDLLLYEASIIEESGDYNELVKFLKENEKQILDKQQLIEIRARTYQKLNKIDTSIALIEKLITINPDNYNYINQIIETKGLKSNAEIFQYLLQIQKQFPSSNAIKRIQLNYAEGEEFKTYFQQYIKPSFQKGLPSLFSDIKSLYNDQNKVKTIGQVLEENLKSLESSSPHFYDTPDVKENPTCLLWNYMILAQHYDKIDEQDKALEYINKAIQHTPTLTDLYLIKAKIYKHLYNYQEASALTNYARTLDLADRYLNNKAIKYFLNNNQVEEAENLNKIYMKHEQDSNCHELQTMWLEIAQGKSHMRLKQYGPGLRQFKFIESHYNDIFEDQFDFHNYCMRKYTLTEYIHLTKFQANLYSNKYFVVAATNMIKGLMEYHDYLQQHGGQVPQTETQKLDQKQIEEQEANDPSLKLKKKLDLDGKKFLETEVKNTPLDYASKLSLKLFDLKLNSEHNKLLSETYSTLFQLYMKTKRVTGAMKFLQKLIDLKYNDTYTLHQNKLQFLAYVTSDEFQKNEKDNTKEQVTKFISQNFSASEATKFNQQFVNENQSDIKAQALGLLVQKTVLNNIDSGKLFEQVHQLVQKNIQQIKIKEAHWVYTTLQQIEGFEQHKQKFQDLLAGKFKNTQCFSDLTVQA